MAKKKKTVKLFVYGSLKKDFPLHGWIEGSKLIGTDKVYGYVLLSLGPYPAMIWTDRETHAVVGEVYEVDADAFKSLRDMEERAGYSTEKVYTYEGNDEVYTFVYASFDAGEYTWTQQKEKFQTLSSVTRTADPDAIPF